MLPLVGAHCCAFRRQEIELDGSEIAECAWLPLEDYVASTEELATERGVGDTMNSWLMRNVAVELRAGSPPSEWAWPATALAAGGARSASHITGWGNRSHYNVHACVCCRCFHSLRARS